jgi:hypothetical protein
MEVTGGCCEVLDEELPALFYYCSGVLRKVAVHLGYGTIWLTVLKLLLKYVVVSLYFVKLRLKCDTGKVSNYLIQCRPIDARGHNYQHLL